MELMIVFVYPDFMNKISHVLVNCVFLSALKLVISLTSHFVKITETNKS